jgi:vitamin B12/bleomycin/antimicrobial peptide transport system ATP-binding/permease protein
MKLDKSVSFRGKAGDVTSIDDITRAVNESMSLPPAEALIGQDKNTQNFSAWRELKTLIKECARSKVARRILLLSGIAMFTLVLNVIGELRMNKWQGAFFRAIETKNLSEVGTQSLFFVLIMVVLLTFVVTQNWLVERVKIRIREWLSHDLLGEWMKHGHAYRLNMTSSERLNPDQRIQEDVKNFSENTGELGIGAARASMMLISFVGLLWVMSSGISFDISGHTIAIPGYMVWFALLYAGLGSWLAARVGSPLITLNEERYGQEAQFRYSLVRVSDNAESISFYSGEKDERKIVDRYLNRVLETMKTLAFANAKLTWIACGHGWMVVILPVLVALPGYLQGKLDFGGLMMVVGAFNQVQTSLRWFVENFGRIAEWRASLHRVVVFREAVLTVDDYENIPETIHLEPHPKGFLEFQKTSISLVDGKVVIADATATIQPGERVLLEGESGSGKSTLLRAVGGLWPWGSGKILLPPRDEMMFLPQKPYIPLGSLAQAITYPNAHGDWSDEDLADCLIRVNLEAFVPMLHDVSRWDKLMSLGQQQRLAFARLLLHQPKWIFLDEATSALDDENQHTMMSLLTEELAGSAVLSVGHRNILEQYHTRTLHLVQSHSGQVLTKKKPKSIEPRKRTFLRKLGSKLRQATANA